MTTTGPLAATRWNKIVDTITSDFDRMVELYMGELLADGYPPFHVAADDRTQYEKLAAAKLAGDPRFWSNPRAQAALAQLEQQFGPVENPPVSPYGEVV